MYKELQLWHFIADRLHRGENVMLLVVTESSGSSPGRQGYKMAVGADGELCGSIGGGVMEVNLVEQSRTILSKPGAIATGFQPAQLMEQEHRKNAEHPSGMICSGKQTVILRRLTTNKDSKQVERIIGCLEHGQSVAFEISNLGFQIIENTRDTSPSSFSIASETEFVYQETVGYKRDLYIIGGGHCALALSELMSKMDFHVSIFDDRPELSTIEKNRFAHEKNIIDSYENIGAAIPQGENIFVAVMTLGYKTDAIVIRQLLDRDLKYFGVLGSKAKMATLIKELKSEGFTAEKLARIRTPIGLPIDSRTPEEIAISIAAEIISVKNA